MDINTRKEKATGFYKAMMSDEKLKKEFIANPLSVLEKEGLLTAKETKIAGVDEYYKSLAKKVGELKPKTDTSGVMLGSFWDDAGCWSCKIASGAVVATAIGAATVASGGTDIPALAAALSISEAAAGAAVGAAGGGIAELTSLLLTQICGRC